MRVLIVEDERASQEALRRLLEFHGFQADAVGSAEQAVTALQSPGSFDVVLLDVDLPGRDGLHLLEVLPQLDPDARPVLVTAANRDRLASAEARGVPYLRKPIDFNRLLAILRANPQTH